MFLGIIVLAIGVVFILKAFGLVSVSSWTLFWGILFLAVGLKMIIRRKHCVHCDWLGYHNLHKDHKDGQQ